MDKLIETYGEQGLVGVLLLGLFALAYFFLKILEKMFENRSELIKHIISTHTEERISLIDVIKKCLTNNKEDHDG